MGLFSHFSKNKQEQPAPDEGHFSSRAAEESSAVRNRNKRGAGRKAGAREDDETLSEKKRARRRLVGAVALVLAVIIGLPMIFDSEPKPLANDIAIQIPAKEKPPAPSSAPAEPGGKSADSAAPNPESLDANEEIVEPARADRAVAEVRTDVKAQPIKPAAPKAAEPASATDKSAAAHTATADKALAAAKSAEKARAAGDAQRAAAILDGKAEAKTEAKAGKFMIRVIALATPEKVTELRGKLSAAGFKSSTQKIDAKTGELTRVLVGPFATREEAEKTREKLLKAGLPAGQLVPV